MLCAIQAVDALDVLLGGPGQGHLVRAVDVEEGREAPEAVVRRREDVHRSRQGAQHAADGVEVEVADADDPGPFFGGEQGDVFVHAGRRAAPGHDVIARVLAAGRLVVGRGVDRALHHGGAVLGLHGEVRLLSRKQSSGSGRVEDDDRHGGLGSQWGVPAPAV